MLQIDEEEVLARRYFLGGCFGLPWLWVVNCAYFYPKLKEGTVSAGARSCENSYFIYAKKKVCFSFFYIEICM